MLKYKAELIGIKVIITEESYTSLCRLQRPQRLSDNIFTLLSFSTTLSVKLN